MARQELPHPRPSSVAHDAASNLSADERKGWTMSQEKLERMVDTLYRIGIPVALVGGIVTYILGQLAR